ncbi:MAG: hypothetical protein ACYDA5_07665 [Vulcanimicrobiaceae bacterium]
MLTRRQLLGGGLAAGAALVIAGLAYEFSPDRTLRDPHYRFVILDEEDRAIVAAIAPVMLAGALPAGAVEQVVRGTDVAIAGLPLHVRAQIRQLFGVLRFPLTRMFVAGIWHPWHSANAGEIAAFLQHWRYSPVVQLRSAYDALHQLLMAAWYGNEQAWPPTGYPGPPKVG